MFSTLIMFVEIIVLTRNVTLVWASVIEVDGASIKISAAVMSSRTVVKVISPTLLVQ